jgi:hypothetical protein
MPSPPPVQVVVVLPPVVPVEPVPVVDDEVAVLQPRRMKKRPDYGLQGRRRGWRVLERVGAWASPAIVLVLLGPENESSE